MLNSLQFIQKEGKTLSSIVFIEVFLQKDHFPWCVHFIKDSSLFF